jgi:hypothetical protein
MNPKPLLEETIELLREARDAGVSRVRIAREAEVGKDWLDQVYLRRIKVPGVTPLERVRDYLRQLKEDGMLAPRSARRAPARGRAAET